MIFADVEKDLVQFVLKILNDKVVNDADFLP